jgi:hypothetical protein
VLTLEANTDVRTHRITDAARRGSSSDRSGESLSGKLQRRELPKLVLAAREFLRWLHRFMLAVLQHLREWLRVGLDAERVCCNTRRNSWSGFSGFVRGRKLPRVLFVGSWSFDFIH